MAKLLDFLLGRRNAPVATISSAMGPVHLDEQTRHEFGIPTWATPEEALDAMAPVPEQLKDIPAITSLDDLPTPEEWLASFEEVIPPVTYSNDEEVNQIMAQCEEHMLALPANSRFRPYTGVALSFSPDALLESAGMADRYAVPVNCVTFHMVLDQHSDQPRRISAATVFRSSKVDPRIHERATRFDHVWHSFEAKAQEIGYLFNPSALTTVSIVEAKISQAMCNPEAADIPYLTEPEVYVGFDTPDVWQVILDSLNCERKRGEGKPFSIHPCKKQLDYIEQEILRGMPVYANAAGKVVYVPWKEQACYDIYIEQETIDGYDAKTKSTRSGATTRIFVGCVPEMGKYYIEEGTHVAVGTLIAAGFPQQADLDGDGQIDRPGPQFEAGSKVSTFLTDNGGFKNTIMVIMKNAMRRVNNVVIAPFALVSRILDRCDPSLTLLVWPISNKPASVATDAADSYLFGVLPLKARRHGHGPASRGLDRDSLVISSVHG